MARCMSAIAPAASCASINGGARKCSRAFRRALPHFISRWRRTATSMSSAPTLASYDSVRRIDPQGRVHALNVPFGRPQGLAFDASGVLHVVEALAGSSGVYAIRPDREPELVVAGAGLVGLAFGPAGEMVVASSDSVFSFPLRMILVVGWRAARTGRGVARPSHHVPADSARASASFAWPRRASSGRFSSSPRCRSAIAIASATWASVSVVARAGRRVRPREVVVPPQAVGPMTPFRTIDHTEARSCSRPARRL